MVDGKAISTVIGGFISILVGITLIKPVADVAFGAESDNVGAAGNTLLGLLALFFIVGIILVAVGYWKLKK